VIKKIGNEWLLFSRDGSRVLGHHDTLASARMQETAIQLAKARRAGHKIPRLKVNHR